MTVVDGAHSNSGIYTSETCIVKAVEAKFDIVIVIESHYGNFDRFTKECN